MFSVNYHFQSRLDFSKCAISGFHSGGNSDYCVPDYDFVYFGTWLSAF